LPASISDSSQAADSTKKSNKKPLSIWETVARKIINPYNDDDTATMEQYVQVVSSLRVGVPSLVAAIIAKSIYPLASMAIAGLIQDDGVFDVVANDYSQYIQNILTTSGLVFSLLIGQTYYFMVRKYYGKRNHLVYI
jgi:hypothetical protein